ncbi:MAG: DUF983 domain-containing protein [Putridiphycobacter sp.]
MLDSTKGLKIYSVANKKCPVCQEGEYFLTHNPYNLKKFDKNHEFCDQCGHKFEIENGFYYGAMYVSYGLSVAIGVSIFMAEYVLFGSLPLWVYIVSIIIGIVLFMPISFRTSRLIWMNMFSGYGKKEIFNK